MAGLKSNVFFSFFVHESVDQLVQSQWPDFNLNGDKIISNFFLALQIVATIAFSFSSGRRGEMVAFFFSPATSWGCVVDLFKEKIMLFSDYIIHSRRYPIPLQCSCDNAFQLVSMIRHRNSSQLKLLFVEPALDSKWFRRFGLI